MPEIREPTEYRGNIERSRASNEVRIGIRTPDEVESHKVIMDLKTPHPPTREIQIPKPLW